MAHKVGGRVDILRHFALSADGGEPRECWDRVSEEHYGCQLVVCELCIYVLTPLVLDLVQKQGYTEHDADPLQNTEEVRAKREWQAAEERFRHLSKFNYNLVYPPL